MKYRYLWNERKDGQGRNTSMFDGYQSGDPLCVAYEEEIGGAGQTALRYLSLFCDTLFTTFNLYRPDDYKGPSMSVGSVIDFGEHGAFAVERAGFKQVDISTSPIVPTDPRWRI